MRRLATLLAVPSGAVAFDASSTVMRLASMLTDVRTSSSSPTVRTRSTHCRTNRGPAPADRRPARSPHRQPRRAARLSLGRPALARHVLRLRGWRHHRRRCPRGDARRGRGEASDRQPGRSSGPRLRHIEALRSRSRGRHRLGRHRCHRDRPRSRRRTAHTVSPPRRDPLTQVRDGAVPQGRSRPATASTPTGGVTEWRRRDERGEADARRPSTGAGDAAARAGAVAPDQRGGRRTLNHQRILELGGESSPAEAAIVGDEGAVRSQLQELVDAGATDIWAANFRWVTISGPLQATPDLNRWLKPARNAAELRLA
jgi:hypothetical protein